MKVLINSYIKRNNDGDFISGRVMFESLVTNEESTSIPMSLVVNLSKHHNPECDTPIRHMQKHNHHAGSFGSHTIMREYIRRVSLDIADIISRHNQDIEELQLPDKKIEYPSLENNEDLVPPPIKEPLDMGLFPMATMDVLEEFHAYLAQLMEEKDTLFGNTIFDDELPDFLVEGEDEE